MNFPVVGFLSGEDKIIIQSKLANKIIVVTSMTVTNKYDVDYNVKFSIQLNEQSSTKITFTDLALKAGEKFVDETEYRLSEGVKIFAQTNMNKNEVSVLINGYELNP